MAKLSVRDSERGIVTGSFEHLEQHQGQFHLFTTSSISTLPQLAREAAE